MNTTLDRIVATVTKERAQRVQHDNPRLEIYSLTPETYQHIATNPGALHTVLRAGEMVSPHSHTFEAWYFTDGVRELFTEQKASVNLPEYAAIRVAPRTVHGWNDVYAGKEQGTITHFHVGHGVHKVHNLY